MSEPTHRLQTSLSKEDFLRLQELSDLKKKSKAEVMRHALDYYYFYTIQEYNKVETE